jgi:hypothetical protein
LRKGIGLAVLPWAAVQLAVFFFRDYSPLIEHYKVAHCSILLYFSSRFCDFYDITISLRPGLGCLAHNKPSLLGAGRRKSFSGFPRFLFRIPLLSSRCKHPKKIWVSKF